MISVIILLNHADTKGISNSAKSTYYRAASILMSTIIEGVAYQLVKKHSLVNSNIIGSSKEYVQAHKIPGTAIGQAKDLFICELQEKDVHIDDNGVHFGKLNIYLKNRGIVTGKHYRKLDRIRAERNKIHVQGLTSADTGYTKAKIKRMSEVLDYLLGKI